MVKIAIKNPSRWGKNLTQWGDYHFGKSLEKALLTQGAEVVQHYWPFWATPSNADVTLVIRGMRPYTPPRNKPAFLWIISHPSTVSLEEINAYSAVFVASETHYNQLKDQTQTPIILMRQCTDITLFTPPTDFEADLTNRQAMIFVANSRGIRRDILQWAIDAGHPPQIFGPNWDKLGLGHLVKQTFVQNRDLPALYRQSRLSLNDHWGDMRYFGVINNRIFDCLASGVPILSDSFPELKRVCGDNILYASNSHEYAEAIKTYQSDYRGLLEKTWRLWEDLKQDYTFDARAEQIVSYATQPLSKPTRRRKPAPSPSLQRIMQLVKRMNKQIGRQSLRDSLFKKRFLLHVFPSTESTQHLANQTAFNYLSTDFGEGAWHIRLQQDMSQILATQFDMILIEHAERLKQLPSPAPFIHNLARCVKANGVIGFSFDAQNYIFPVQEALTRPEQIVATVVPSQ
jgi:hypothetical protein